MQALIRLLLTRGGYEVVTVDDGIDALMTLGRRSFDLILSDINMPNMDGLSLIQFVKQKGVSTPVAFLTAETAEEREQQGLALGAVNFIRKPFSAATLLDSVKQAMAAGTNSGDVA